MNPVETTDSVAFIEVFCKNRLLYSNLLYVSCVRDQYAISVLGRHK